MALTTAQLATLKAAILADPVLSALPMTYDAAYEIADVLHVLSAPAYIVWKTSVNPDDIMRNGMDWTRVDNLSVGKARIWDWLCRLGTFNPSRTNIRAGIDAAWVGTAADLAVRAAVYVHCKRTATKAEQILTAGGTGTDVSPALLGWEGHLIYQDVYDARMS
jgi:hypothetical protein